MDLDRICRPQSNTYRRASHVTREILVLSSLSGALFRNRRQGVVFNAHYLTYFDTTITEYFRALGYDQYADAKQTGEDFHVVKSLIEYKAPVRFDWELDVGARVARIGNSSLTFELAIFLKGGTDALVTGEIVWVNTNQQTHRPVPISKSIREKIVAREHHLA